MAEVKAAFLALIAAGIGAGILLRMVPSHAQTSIKAVAGLYIVVVFLRAIGALSDFSAEMPDVLPFSGQESAVAGTQQEILIQSERTLDTYLNGVLTANNLPATVHVLLEQQGETVSAAEAQLSGPGLDEAQRSAAEQLLAAFLPGTTLVWESGAKAS